MVKGEIRFECGLARKTGTTKTHQQMAVYSTREEGNQRDGIGIHPIGSVLAGVAVVVGIFTHITVVLAGRATCHRTNQHKCRKGHYKIPFHTR
jgi:hypothetical protein